MGMNRKMTVWVAVGLSVLAWLFYRMHVGRKTDEINALYGSRTAVWVATRDMLAGHVMEELDVQIQEAPAAFIQPGAVTNEDWAPAGGMVQVPIRKGEQILVTKLAQDGAGMLSLRVAASEGMRAITLKMDGEGGLVGLLQPRDRIDIIGVFESSGSSTEITRSHAVVLAQAVAVLAVDQRMGERAVGEEAVPEGAALSRTGSTVPMTVHVTVQVTSAEAWRLSLASQMAYLRCILRNRRNEKIETLQPPQERLSSLKGDEVFGARVPVKIRTSTRSTLDELAPF
jgi:Flp pilus assembly protein CpaB